MATTYAAYTGNGSVDTFSVPFPYLSKAHVQVLVNGTPQILPHRWLNDSTVKLHTVPGAGDKVVIQRVTPMDSRLVQFQNGSVLTQQDLNTAVAQVFYIQQELQDSYEDAISDGLSRLSDGSFIEGSTALDKQEAIAQEILNTAVVADLQQRITDIDLNAQSILDEAARVTSLQATVDVLADIDGTGISTFIQNEQIARIDADAAINEKLDLIGAKSADSLAYILNMEKVRVDPTTSLATRLSALDASVGDNVAAITAEESARAAADTAEAVRVDGLLATVNSNIAANTSAITTEESARVAADTAEATRVDALLATVNSNIAANTSAIVTEQTARANGDSAEASARTALAARVTTAEGAIAAAEASILAEQTSRADGDGALASDLALMGAKSGDGAAWYLDETTVQVFKEGSTTIRETLGTRLSGFDVSLSGNAAAIANEVSARVTADAAISSDITQLENRMSTAEGGLSGNTTAIASLQGRVTTAEGDITAINGSITNLDSSVSSLPLTYYQAIAPSSHKAGDLWWDSDDGKLYRSNGTSWVAIQDQDIVSNANAYSALETRVTATEGSITSTASDVTALTTTVNGNTATLTQHASSLNGLEAKYGVTLDVNGYITGFSQNNDGSSGTFKIRADKFVVIDPDGGSAQNGTIPFEIDNGVTYIRDLMVKNLAINKLVTGSLNGDMNMGTGRIILDNGVFIKVMGLGFGSTNQFLEWFGPKMALNLMTEANAISYIKTNGDSYYGGSLSAGILTTSASTSSLAADASVTVGPLGTNGNNKQVVASITISGSYETGTWIPFDEISDTTTSWGSLTLYVEEYTGGIWVTRMSQVFTGSKRSRESYNAENNWSGTRTDWSLSGSLTWTDSDPSTSDRTYRARISDGDASTLVGSISQRVTIISTEE